MHWHFQKNGKDFLKTGDESEYNIKSIFIFKRYVRDCLESVWEHGLSE